MDGVFGSTYSYHNIFNQFMVCFIEILNLLIVMYLLDIVAAAVVVAPIAAPSLVVHCLILRLNNLLQLLATRNCLAAIKL